MRCCILDVTVTWLVAASLLAQHKLSQVPHQKWEKRNSVKQNQNQKEKLRKGNYSDEFIYYLRVSQWLSVLLACMLLYVGMYIQYTSPQCNPVFVCVSGVQECVDLRSPEAPLGQQRRPQTDSDWHLPAGCRCAGENEAPPTPTPPPGRP